MEGKLSYADAKTLPTMVLALRLAVLLKGSSCCFIPEGGQGL